MRPRPFHPGRRTSGMAAIRGAAKWCDGFPCGGVGESPRWKRKFGGRSRVVFAGGGIRGAVPIAASLWPEPIRVGKIGWRVISKKANESPSREGITATGDTSPSQEDGSRRRFSAAGRFINGAASGKTSKREIACLPGRNPGISQLVENRSWTPPAETSR